MSTTTTEEALQSILAMHQPREGFSCGARTEGKVYLRHLFGSSISAKVLTCTQDDGHEGLHRDGGCCWKSHQFAEAVRGPRQDRRWCVACGHSWPCRTFLTAGGVDPEPPDTTCYAMDPETGVTCQRPKGHLTGEWTGNGKAPHYFEGYKWEEATQ